MEQKVILRYLRIAPRKVRSVADLIRGLSVNEAEAQLLMERRRPAVAIRKLLRSGIAAAKTESSLDPSTLYVKEIRVDGGPSARRFLPRARGVATRILKRTSHLTMVLASRPESPAGRFTFASPKKRKKREREVERARREKPPREEKEKGAAPKREKKGLWRRIFRRKAV